MRKTLLRSAIAMTIFSHFIGFISMSSTKLVDAQKVPEQNATSSAYRSRGITESPKTSTISWDLLEWPMLELRARAHQLATDKKYLAAQDYDRLETLANEAVLTRLINALYVDATAEKWVQTLSYRTYSMNLLLSNSARDVPTTFNPNGLRVGILALKNSKFQRGIMISTSFLSDDPTELRGLFRKETLVPMIDKADDEYKTFAAKMVQRFSSYDSRMSNYPAVVGKSDAWSLRCDTIIAGHFCVIVSIFNAKDTDPTAFTDALSGMSDSSETARLIRRQNLAWPVQTTYISRGLKPFGTPDHHYGLDLTAAIGTPVRAVQDGTVLHAKGGWSGWGNAVIIEHKLPNGQKYLSLYAHLSKFRKGLKPGDSIRRGEIVALSGKSGSSAQGKSIPPHLHLEIRNIVEGKEPLQLPKNKADQPIDPLHVLDIFNLIVGS